MFSLLSLGLPACLDPSLTLLPVPERPVIAEDVSSYQCEGPDGAACPPRELHVLLKGYWVLEMGARGDTGAFVARRLLNDTEVGALDVEGDVYLGRINLKTGALDWLVTIGKGYDYDVGSVSHVQVAPGGDIVVSFSGYGNTLIGEKRTEFEGIVARFDSQGNKRFATRIELLDQPPASANLYPRINTLALVAGNIRTYVNTSSYFADGIPHIHLLALEADGSMAYLKELYASTSTYSTWMWPAADGSMWIFGPPGDIKRWSHEGELIESFEIPVAVDVNSVRGLASQGSRHVLINLSTKGMTNELYLLDSQKGISHLHDIPTFPEHNAGQIRATPDLTGLIFEELGYTIQSIRFSRIDIQGKRGPAYLVHGVDSRFAVLDGSEGVLIKYTKAGTEWIRQPF